MRAGQEAQTSSDKIRRQTAQSFVARRTAAIELGAGEFLAKPVSIEDFINRVRTQCDTARGDNSLVDTLAVKTRRPQMLRRRYVRILICEICSGAASAIDRQGSAARDIFTARSPDR